MENIVKGESTPYIYGMDFGSGDDKTIFLSNIYDQCAKEYEKFKQMAEERNTRDISDEELVSRDISAIKREIKHCKNPMRRVELERELTDAYIDKRNERRASKASKKKR